MLSRFLLSSAMAILWTAAAQAAPILEIDTDPGAPGVQADSEFGLPVAFTVDILVSGVEPASPLNAFEFDLFFDPLLLTPTAVIGGGFLMAPTLVIQQSLGALAVEFAEATLGSGGAVGDGVIASVTFAAIAPGVSVLGLDAVVLSAPFGVPIAVGGLADATVTVVPEPRTLSLFSLGLAAFGGRRWQGSRRGGCD